MAVVNSVRSDEVQHYWRVMQQGIARASLTEYQDELEVLAMYTDSPALQAACAKNLTRFDRVGSTLRVATGK